MASPLKNDMMTKLEDLLVMPPETVATLPEAIQSLFQTLR